MAAEAHLPLIIFKTIVEVNILSDSGRPYRFGNRSILANILIPHKGYKNDIWRLGKAAYQIIRLVLGFFPISPEDGPSLFPKFFRSKHPQYRIA